MSRASSPTSPRSAGTRALIIPHRRLHLVSTVGYVNQGES